jgi:hypothetical protein
MRRFLTLASALLVLAAPAAAQDRAIRIRDFNALLVVGRDGTLDVTERLTIRFDGKWNGLNRDLRLEHQTAEGRSAFLDVELGSVTDGDGRPLKVEEEEINSGYSKRLKIWIPGAENAERQVVIRYHVGGALRFFYAGSEPGPMDELYWNVTGNEWEMPIDRASGRVVLPEGATPARWSVYTGPAGTGLEGSRATSRASGRTLAFAADAPLAEGDGVTVAVGWAPGFVAARRTEAQYRRAETLRWWPLALPLLVFAAAFRFWRRGGRDPRPESVVVQYAPPEEMTPAEAGTLLDHKAEMRDITATLVDLAVRGYIGIEERTEKKLFGLMSDTEFVFHTRRPREAWAELAEHENLYLTGLFQSARRSGAAWEEIRAAAHAGRGEPSPEIPYGQTEGTEFVELSSLQNRFYNKLPGIRNALYRKLITRGYYTRRPDHVKNLWMGLAIAALALGFGGGIVAGGNWGSAISTEAALAAGLASAVILFVFSRIMPARTPAGARAREAVLGFREFLSRVESDRYRRMITSPEMFERFLPFAMAFGVEERWATAFDELYTEPPQWYNGSGDGPFRAWRFSSRMHSMSSSAASTMASSPSSSGSGGGGSSGGGSGGGGGSGF